jgi:selenide,water dikinase
MAVVGIADPARIVTNAAARPGDVLVLTKPVGTGVIATGIKRGIASVEAAGAAVATMTTLNREAAEAMLAAGVRAATDVTGFGLLGHLQRMTVASGVAAGVSAAAVPVIDPGELLVVGE